MERSSVMSSLVEKLGVFFGLFFIATLVLAALGFFTKGDPSCPACKSTYGLRPVYDMEDKLLRWKCPKCWYPVRVEEVKVQDAP